MTVSVTFVPQQASTAVGGVNVQGVPKGTTKLVPQVSTGGVVSTTVTVWLQVAALPQGPRTLVIALAMETVTFGQQRSVAVGGAMGVPHCTTRLLTQLIVGGVVSTTLTIWLQNELLPQQSVAFQLNVMSSRHGPRT